MYRSVIHYGIHFLLPLAIALIWFRGSWKKTYFIFLLGFCIDIDHLWATPIFSDNRCSINYHFLHTYYAIAIYILALIPKKTRWLGIGLICHIIADITDCYLMANPF